MPKMARNRSALHDVLAQGTSNRDITVYHIDISVCSPPCESVWPLGPDGAEFIQGLGNKYYIYIHIHVLSCLNTEMAQVVEFLPQRRKGPVYRA